MGAIPDDDYAVTEAMKRNASAIVVGAPGEDANGDRSRQVYRLMTRWDPGYNDVPENTAEFDVGHDYLLEMTVFVSGLAGQTEFL